MVISTRGKKFEFFEVDDFINFLVENNYDFERKDAINFFIEHKIDTIRMSQLPFQKQKVKQKPKKESKQLKPKKESKSKTQILMEKSGCPEKFIEYLKRTKQEIKAFENPPQRFLKKKLFYVYLPDFEYYALVIQDNFNYFRDFKYEIIDYIEDFYFNLYYIKLSLLKKYFESRKILNINEMCHFEGFDKKIIDKLPKEPVLKIDYMEELI